MSVQSERSLHPKNDPLIAGRWVRVGRFCEACGFWFLVMMMGTSLISMHVRIRIAGRRRAVLIPVEQAEGRPRASSKRPVADEVAVVDDDPVENAPLKRFRSSRRRTTPPRRRSRPPEALRRAQNLIYQKTHPKLSWHMAALFWEQLRTRDPPPGM